jgi:hypothetical protein
VSTGAVAIRDAIYDRLAGISDYNRTRKQDTRQLQAEDLPSLMVKVVSEDMTPDGDPNAGVPSFITNATIGISVVRGFKAPAELDADIDADADLVLNTLLTDPAFVGFPGRDPDDPNPAIGLFEATTHITRRRTTLQQGETYMLELRLEMTFQTRCYFEPVIPDHYKGMTIRTALPTHTPPPQGATIQQEDPVLRVDEADWT